YDPQGEGEAVLEEAGLGYLVELVLRDRLHPVVPKLEAGEEPALLCEAGEAEVVLVAVHPPQARLHPAPSRTDAPARSHEPDLDRLRVTLGLIDGAGAEQRDPHLLVHVLAASPELDRGLFQVLGLGARRPELSRRGLPPPAATVPTS